MLVWICTLLFGWFGLALSTTDLEVKCNAISSPHLYSNGSCYIVHTETKMYNNAKLSCRDMLGYSGHLIHIRSSAIQALTESLMKTAGSLANIWVGNEYFNGTASARNNTGWYYTTMTKTFEDPATYIPWNNQSTVTGNFMRYQANQNMTACSYATAYAFICEYEEQYAYAVTAAEVYCNSTETSIYYTYVDGSCFFVIMKAGNLFADASANYRNSCSNVAGLVGRRAHLPTSGKMNMARTFGRAYSETYSYGLDTSYIWAIGLEQLKGCSGNTCSEEPGYSWFWTTPEGYKWPANTKIAGFWAPGYPQDTSSGTLNYMGYGSAAGPGMADYAAFNQVIICEYLAPYALSNFSKSCLRSSNPSAPGYSSCFTLVRNATTIANAQSRCTEFPNGHLARIDSIEIAQFISSALWANSGLPPSQPPFIGLQQFIATPADEPGGSWYWIYPDGSKLLADATTLPWNPGQPQSAGNCGSVTQNGLLNTTNCTASQWFICQYPDPSIASLTSASGKHYNHYLFGRFADNSYWLSQATVPLYKCIFLCSKSQSCFGLSYSKATSDCQLLAVDPSALPYSQQLVVDSRYETVVRAS